jgi:putative endonuclease
MASDERRRREAAGRRAELLCTCVLRLKGYRVLARRFKVPVGEIDIIARRGAVVAFIEVKSRPSAALAVESLTARQRRRIARAALAWLQKRPELQRCDQRFDVMLVAPWKAPRHIIDAWRES